MLGYRPVCGTYRRSSGPLTGASAPTTITAYDHQEPDLRGPPALDPPRHDLQRTHLDLAWPRGVGRRGGAVGQPAATLSKQVNLGIVTRPTGCVMACPFVPRMKEKAESARPPWLRPIHAPPHWHIRVGG